MSLVNAEIEAQNVRCICCKEVIQGVQPKASLVVLALSYPDRYDDDMEGLLCDECWKNCRGASAWLHHCHIRTCTKLPGRGANHT